MENARQSRAQMAAQHDLSERLNSLKNALQAAESGIFQYTILLEDDLRHQTLALLTLVRQEVRMLERTAQTGLGAPVADLREQLGELDRRVRALFEVSSEAATRFPAIPIFLDELNPTNEAFGLAAALALHEAQALPDARLREELTNLLWDLRYSWSQLVSWIRVFTANRSGTFGSPEASLQHNLTNIEIYFDRVAELIGRLEDYERRGVLSLGISQSFGELKDLHAFYRQRFDYAHEVYLSDDWRADLPIIRTDIQPLLAGIWQRLHALEEQLEGLAHANLEHSAQTASMLSRFIWFFTAFVGLLLLAAYAAFESSIRRPILQVVQAMDAEAQGISYTPLFRGSTDETRLLLRAFGRMRDQVNTRQIRMQSILDNAAEGIITIDEAGNIESFNSAAQHLFGYQPREVLGKNAGMLLDASCYGPDQSGFGGVATQGAGTGGGDHEVLARRKDGTTFPMVVKLSELEVSGSRLLTAMVEDVSERKAMIENLRRLAEHDSLTGLFNRFYFNEELARVVERGRRGKDASCALLYIDLDNFKYVNDSLGHLAGDQLLVAVGALLRKRARRGDLLARLGGDEFAAILYDVDDAGARQAAESYREQLGQFSFRYNGHLIDIGCSIGVAMLEPDIASREDLLARADFSCHVAKRGGRNQVHMYSAQDRHQMATLSEDMGWARRIKQAIEQNRFVIACQPIVDVNSRTVHSYEVLLRMLDEHGNIVMPGGFLPAAERFGLMVDVDKWVLHHAIGTLAEQRREDPSICYSLNLSAPSVGDEGVLAVITAALERSGLDASAIIIEITETVAIASLDKAADFLARLRELGCQTALDDFGVGYSSFAYLKELPVDYVKIDGSFVKGIHQNRLNQTIVHSMHEVAKAMGKRTVAEFVESEECMQVLRQIGVDLAQGFHLGRPDIALPCKAIGEHAGIAGACSL